ncbi:MAG: hypothetical protein HY671_07520 [Chloroflexi bacterium]|nr:hypothetical protein [Chloroflexota bacterium]
MESKVFNKGFRFLGVLAVVLLVVAACRPVAGPGAAPREIEGLLGLTEEVAPFGEVEQLNAFSESAGATLSEENSAIAEAATLEDSLGRQLDSVGITLLEEDIFGIDSAPVVGQVEEHMVTEFSLATVSLEEELMAVDPALREGWFEEHMVTEFPAGIVTLDDEFLSAIGVATPPVEESLSIEELAPVMEELAPVLEEDAAVLEGQLEAHMVTEFSAVPVSIEDELLDVGLALREGWFEEHMVTEFPAGIATLDDESLSALEISSGVIDEFIPILDEGFALVGQLEEHMLTEFSAVPVSIEEELGDVGLAFREGWSEEHMVTEFPAGIVGADDERLLAAGVSGEVLWEPAMGEDTPIMEGMAADIY